MKGILAIAESVKGKTLINRKKLLAMIPLSDRTIYNMEQRGEFPHRIALTSRNVAWDAAFALQNHVNFGHQIKSFSSILGL